MAVRVCRLLNFAQIAGVLGGFDLNWPGEHRSGLAFFLDICGILDFDLDVTGPHCIVQWSWVHDMALQLSLPVMVGLSSSVQALRRRPRTYLCLPQAVLINGAELLLLSVTHPVSDPKVLCRTQPPCRQLDGDAPHS